MFKKLLRVISYIKPYWLSATLNVISNLLLIVFSLVSFFMIIPVLNLLFGLVEAETVKPDLVFNPENLVDSLEKYLNYELGIIIEQNGHIQALIYICVVFFALFFLRNLFRFSALFFLAIVRIGAVKDIRNNIYKKILILPISFYSKQKKGDIIARLTSDVQEIEFSIMNYLEMIFRDPFMVAIYLTSLFLINSQLTLVVLISLPVAGLIIGGIGRRLRKESKIGQAKLGGLLAVIEETISGLRIIKGFTAINFTNRKFLDLNKSYSKTLMGIYVRRDSASPISEFLSTTVVLVIIWFGGRLILSGDSSMNATKFITYIVIFSQIIQPAKNLTTAFYNVIRGMASADRIFEILDAEEVIVEKDDAIAIQKFENDIEYRNVSFKYESEEVLKNINIKIGKGKLIALVGPSGGGKSTFADLLPRFYDTSKGEILIDGVDLRDYNINSVRGLMGIVTQEAILFNDTVYNNIAFGKEGFTEEEVINAAKIANAHEFISQMDEGYHTNIGDRGTKLSGGQKQRISIARAVLRNPPILILDEATSALDTESERLVQDALAKVMSNRTTIAIAHRLSTIIHADEIVVLQKGEIVERGTHQELLKQEGVYKKLYELQTFES